MTLAETARLLALVQTYDNRKVDELVVASWHAVMSHLAFTDACQAVREHYTRSRDWVMPVDVLDGVKRIRTDRVARTIEMPPDADPDDVEAYLDALRDGRTRTAAGDRAVPARALEQQFRDVPAASPAAIEAAKDEVRRIRPAPREPLPIPTPPPAPPTWPCCAHCTGVDDHLGHPPHRLPCQLCPRSA